MIANFLSNGHEPIMISQSPGRINLIGEHTDYNEGFVLPAAVDKKTISKIQKNGTASTCRFRAVDLDEYYTFDLKDFAPIEGGWQNYIMGVVHELQQIGAQFEGFDCEFGGNVPIGGGMSSSASLECSIAFGLNELFELGFEKFQLIKAAQRSEHNFVGIKCGIMDQFSSVMGKKDHVIFLDCRSIEYKYYPLSLGDYQLLLLNSNVSHALASSEYNTRRSECERSVEIIKEEYPDVVKLRDVSLQQLNSLKGRLGDTLYRRAHHIVSENDRVQQAVKLLLDADLNSFGKLVYASHNSLQNDYEVSCSELDFLVELTKDKDYILGSRMMGGGFGGCTINIIEKDKVEAFIDEAKNAYQKAFGTELTPYLVSIEDGAGRVIEEL